MRIKPFYDETTYTLTYVVYDETSKDAVLIDPVLNYDPGASQISLESYKIVSEFLKSNHLNLHYVLETHAHADHLSSSQYFKGDYPEAKVAIGENITQVQQVFKQLFNWEDLKTDGSQFDVLLKDREVIQAGTLKIKVINTPGHTPACVSYWIKNAVFTGDALFIEDYGTGRCDFPGGSVNDSYTSIHNTLYNLPENTRVFVGHDYQPGGRAMRYETTIGTSKLENKYLQDNTTRAEFAKFRTERDRGLAAPRLLLPSVQVNINAGNLPKPEKNGMSYLKIPVRSK